MWTLFVIWVRTCPLTLSLSVDSDEQTSGCQLCFWTMGEKAAANRRGFPPPSSVRTCMQDANTKFNNSGNQERPWHHRWLEIYFKQFQKGNPFAFENKRRGWDCHGNRSYTNKSVDQVRSWIEPKCTIIGRIMMFVSMFTSGQFVDYVK